MKNRQKSLDSIGQSAKSSDQKIVASTRSVIAQIQRMTAEMESGGGIHASISRPPGLSARAGCQCAQAVHGPARQGIRQSCQRRAVGQEMSFALRGVPAQFTDIAVSLASGQQPLTVLLQQGGQLKDMFGGIGPAAKPLAAI